MTQVELTEIETKVFRSHILNNKFLSDFISSDFFDDSVSPIISLLYKIENNSSSCIKNEFDNHDLENLAELCFQALIYFGYEHGPYQSDEPKILNSLGIRFNKLSENVIYNFQ